MIYSNKNDLDIFVEFDSLNLGTGDTPTSSAVALNDVTGTFRNYVLITQFDDKIVKETGQIQLDVVAIDLSGNTVFTCSATYWIGSTRNWSDVPISTDVTWDSLNDSGVGNGFHDYLSGSITNGSSMSFAKLLFGENEGYTNFTSVDISFTLVATNGLQVNTNVNSENNNDRALTPLTLFLPSGFRRLNSNVDLINQGFQTTVNSRPLKEYNTNLSFSTSKYMAYTGAAMHFLEIDYNNPSDIEPTLYHSHSRDIFFTRILGYDAEQMPNFDTPTNTGVNTAAGFTPPAPMDVCIYPNYTNQMPDMFWYSFKGQLQTRLIRNTGDYLNPDYSDIIIFGLNAASSGDWEFVYSYDIVKDSTDKFWVLWNRLSTQIHRVSIFEFTGADYSSPLDWTRTDIMNNTTITSTSVPAEGDGQNACLNDMWYIYVDEDNIVNGNPTLYFCGDRYIIMRGTHNGGIAGDETDWAYNIILGAVDVSGYIDANGINARFHLLRGISIHDKVMYIGGYVNRVIRAIDVDPISPNYLDVTTYLGTQGVTTNLDAILY